MSKSKFSECLAQPKDSKEHRQLRDELWLVGATHACRYYLSILLNQDFFAASDKEFLDAVRRYLSERCCPETLQFCSGFSDLQVIAPFLKWQWQLAEGDCSDDRMPKAQRALILLLQHPSWTNEQIRAAVSTTQKQMARWCDYNLARRTQKLCN